jgi:hypothetical protein
MKFYTLLCLFFSALLFSSVWAQPTVGIKAGINFAKVTSDPEMKNPGDVRGYSGAFFTNYFIYDFFNIQAELALNQKGYTFEDSMAFNVKKTLTYLEIPLLFKAVYSPGPENTKELYIGAGPSIGYLLLGRESTNDYTSFNELVITDFYNRFEYGLTGGIGISFSIGFGFLTVESRYFYGMSKIDKSEYNPKNSTVNISVGYMFYKGRRGFKRRIGY